MNKQTGLWRLIVDCLEAQAPVMLLYVLESSGSSPGRQGFGMAVCADGRMEGSIGGGIMEHKLVAMAREALKKDEVKDSRIRKQVHSKAAPKNRSGMICSGEQTVLLYPILSSSLGEARKLLAASIDHRGGMLQLSPGGPRFFKKLPAEDFYFAMKDESDWVYREKTGHKNHLYLVGGGHCALALCRLVSGLDFHIHLCDDREALHTMEQNSYAHEKIRVKDYSELENRIPSGRNHYVVIMTFGYRTDALALKALLRKRFRYIGVLGSKSKIAQLFEDLRKEGCPPKALGAVHAPIGLPINSRTPEEIAVSIAAQLIAVKNRE